MICFNSNIISLLSYRNPYLASQVSARGISRKDISMFHAKKRYYHAERNVSFMNNPEAERQGHLLNSY
jgi:hypothetical protein